MAVIQLSELVSFEKNFQNQNRTYRINSLDISLVYNGNQYTTILAVSDQKDSSLLFFERDGALYGASPSKEIKDVQSFTDLGIKTIDGSGDYKPQLSWIDASCNDKIYAVDAKLNTKDKTQHIVKYDNPKKGNKYNFILEDVIAQIDDKKIFHFALSESRSYDHNYGCYPLKFYAINSNKEVLEFDTKDYKSKIFANPQSLTWKLTGFDQKEGFVRLTENVQYWGNRDELVYALSLKKDPIEDYFFLELINSDNLYGNLKGYYKSTIKKAPDKIKLNFGNHIDYNGLVLPKFDSSACLDEKEFLISMIPVVNNSLDTSCREIYWFRLNSSKDEAILLADPFRLDNIDRFDKLNGYEGSVCVGHEKDSSTMDDFIYVVTRQNTIKKFKLDLQP